MCRLINLSAIFVIISVILNLVYTIPLPQNGKVFGFLYNFLINVIKIN